MPTRAHADTKTKNLNKKPTTDKTQTVRTKDIGHRKIRASSCPRSTYDTEHKSRSTERTSQKMKPSETNVTVALKEQQKTENSRALCETNSQKAFTVFAPNPKKRQDIQQKAASELAALEELRLSRAMGYISISSTVGGCLTLEEVRAKQQQEMQIKRRQKQVKNIF